MTDFSISQAARECGAELAVVVGSQRITFAEAAEGAARAAAWLDDCELPEGGLVACTPTRTLETLYLVYALMELGQPMALLHPRWSPAETATVLESWRPSLVVPNEIPLPVARGTERSWLGRTISDKATLAVVATSGSSAAPRGVRLSRAAFAASAEAHEAHVSWMAQDRWLVSLPLAHVGGLSIVTRSLHARRPIVLPEKDGQGGISELARIVREQEVSLLSLVPTQLYQLLELPAWELPSSVRVILLGGAPAASHLLERAAQRNWPILPTYGLTEACSQVATQEYARRFTADSDVGRALPGTALRVIDGEIQVRGRTLFDAYHPSGESARTSDGWFPTGDLGEFDVEGRLLVSGRRGDLIITGGENVHPGEVERCLLECPGVADVCVVGVPDEAWGQMVTALVVRRPGVALSSDDVARYSKSTLAAFRRPRRVVFVDALPTGANGKLDRAAAFAVALRR